MSLDLLYFSSCFFDLTCFFLSVPLIVFSKKNINMISWSVGFEMTECKVDVITLIKKNIFIFILNDDTFAC